VYGSSAVPGNLAGGWKEGGGWAVVDIQAPRLNVRKVTELVI
jgi:hypothetical protein